MTTHTIFIGATVIKGGQVVKDSTGRMFTAYTRTSPSSALVVAYSDDGGGTWTEVATSLPTGGSNVRIAIDASDILHVLYERGTYIVSYRQFAGLTWGSEEDIYDGTSTLDDVKDVDICVDSTDLPHAVWIQELPSSTEDQVWYSARTGGTWDTPTALSGATHSGTNIEPATVKIVANSQDELYVFFTTPYGISNIVLAVKYTGSWSSTFEILSANQGSLPLPGLVVDPDDNLHLTFSYGALFNNAMIYIKYTDATDTWESNVTMSDSSASGTHALSMTEDGVLRCVFLKSSSLYYIESEDGGDSWGANGVIYDHDDFPNPEASLGISSVSAVTDLGPAIYPKLSGVSTQPPTSGYHGTYMTGTTLKYYEESVVLPAPEAKNYSKDAQVSLPTDDAGGQFQFTPGEYGDVADEDGDFASSTAEDSYAIYVFKDKNTSNSAPIAVAWKGKSNIAPSVSPIVLEIYNQDAEEWEELDRNDSAAAHDLVTLEGGIVSNLSDYYDAGTFVTCRVWQLATD